MRLVKGLLERCVEVVELLSAHPGGLRLSDLARTLDMPKVAAHRLLTELARLGWVEQAEGGAYRLAHRLPLVTQRVLHASGLPDLSRAVLDRIAAGSRELARAALALPDRLVWLAQAQGAPPGLIYQPAMTDDVSPHATANGKAWLSTLEPGAALAIAGRAGLGLGGPGPRAVADAATLARELETVRARGWALAVEEAEAGVAALAVPVRAGPGPAVATLSIAGPLVRLPPARHPELAALLLAAATDLGRAWPAPRQDTTRTVEETA
ncbi:helix-turn-helix domain-containing protein [Roseomonas sp. OT10]|uniref:IclR family transcriptional regulator n=1 Tax=Roseomonas cutis TaxID=2897332 RepID=UPI001E59E4FA|nr:IclR family transcriptional regulator C-terminal domain-containing protein [Roseomonas sp. OT10]UFN49443.1 helix-turn-helix domain-containing protein [Roseomonas sp. OT10]